MIKLSQRGDKRLPIRLRGDPNVDKILTETSGKKRGHNESNPKIE
jgi:hypothetical protein